MNMTLHSNLNASQRKELNEINLKEGTVRESLEREIMERESMVPEREEMKTPVQNIASKVGKMN
jgi:hypothetical protein